MAHQTMFGRLCTYLFASLVGIGVVIGGLPQGDCLLGLFTIAAGTPFLFLALLNERIR